MKKKKRKKYEDIILLVIGIVCFSVFCITGFLLIDYYVESYKQERLNEQLAELKHGSPTMAIRVEAEPLASPIVKTDSEVIEQEFEEEVIEEEQEIQEEIQGLKDINPDYVMWLQIPDTIIDYPVVQRDNSFYLQHDFTGEKSSHGTIFLDESCEITQNFLLLHGHHMKDGTMFGGLKNYKKAAFREEHRDVTLDFETGKKTYEIFAGALIDLLHAERFRFEVMPQGEEEMKSYLQQLEANAFWYEKPEWEEGTSFIVLSTCDYGTDDQRLIIVAVEQNK